MGTKRTVTAKKPAAKMASAAEPVDMINKPPHYARYQIEPIDFVSVNDFNFLEGNVIKYVSRYKYKGKPVEDLNKAKFYLEKLIQHTYVKEVLKDEA